MWLLDRIADAAFTALEQRDAALREEQAVYGLDALPELDFHPLIAAGLASHTGHWALGTEHSFCGVLREQPFPHEWIRKLRPAKDHLALPLPRDRMRCDIVLTPEPNQVLDDALLTEKTRRAEAKALTGSLFESVATDAPSSLGTGHSALGTCAPESCFWLELKLVGQFTTTSGIPGPNRTYTSELTRAPIADLKKLADDHRIQHGGVLLIVFSADKATADHDLTILAHRCLDKDLPIPIGGPITRSFPIPDRIGNTLCTVCLIGLRKSE